MKWIFKGICIAIVISLAALGFGYITMQLWNWLMPAIFGLKVITYWQAFGLLILAKILFGGMGKGKGGHHRCGPGGHWGRHRGGMWRKRWEEKMAKMSPEEKEKVMRHMSRCGWEPGASWQEEGFEKRESSSSNNPGN